MRLAALELPERGQLCRIEFFDAIADVQVWQHRVSGERVWRTIHGGVTLALRCALQNVAYCNNCWYALRQPGFA